MKLVILFILSLLFANVQANTGAGYTEINSATGWKIWKKELNGATIHVQEIDVTKRQLQFVHNNPNGDIFSKFLVKDKYASLGGRLSLSNGAFFESSADTTGLSYGYKVGLTTYTHGWSTQRDYSSLRMLVYTSHPSVPTARSVKVVPYSKSEFDLSSTQNALVGLSPYYNADGTDWSKRSTEKIGRTFVGVKGNILFILNTDKMTQDNTRLELLNNFGVDNNNIIMFDGATSTQLSFKKKDGGQEDFVGCRTQSLCAFEWIYRKIPQGIAVY